MKYGVSFRAFLNVATCIPPLKSSPHSASALHPPPHDPGLQVVAIARTAAVATAAIESLAAHVRPERHAPPAGGDAPLLQQHQQRREPQQPR